MRKFIVAMSILGPGSAFCQAPSKQDLTELPLEDLMKMQVVTASKSEERLSKIPAAIYVITQEAIRRSGAANVPEALRLAPGVMVSQKNATQWMISIRGFSGIYVDKLLVLVDGRSVYSPLIGGVLWDEEDMPIENIDRIEVIRGPGGSLWGANAVNGIINIVTKDASKTLGWSSSAITSSSLGTATTLQYGDKLSNTANYRVYGKWSQADGLGLNQSLGAPDSWTSAKTGFRVDGGREDGNRYTVIGDLQNEHITQSQLQPPDSLAFSATNFDLVGRWQQSASNRSTQSLQAYIDGSSRVVNVETPVYERRTTVDLDYQARFAPFGKQTFTLGSGFRISPDSTSSATGSTTLSPSSATQTYASFFGRDSIRLGDHTDLLLGSKIERNNYTGWEIQPDARVLYTPSESRTYWASVSRAVATPTRVPEGIRAVIGFDPVTGVETLLSGNPAEQSQSVLSFEVGSRVSSGNDTFVDLAAFYSEYDRLITISSAGSPYMQGGLTVVPVIFGNQRSAQMAGLEAVIEKHVRPWWKLSGSCSLLGQSMGSDAFTSKASGENTPAMLQMHSNMNLPKNFEFDCDLFYMDGFSSGDSHSYIRLDSRFGWNPSKSLQLSLGVVNALSPRHVEANDYIVPAEQIPRSVYLKATIRF